MAEGNMKVDKILQMLIDENPLMKPKYLGISLLRGDELTKRLAELSAGIKALKGKVKQQLEEVLYQEDNRRNEIIKELQNQWREHHPGGCHILNSDCRCHLCLLDELRNTNNIIQAGFREVKK